MSTNRTPATSTTVIVVAVVVMFCFAVAAILGLAVFAPQGTDVGSLTTALLTSLAAVVPAVVTLVKVNGVEQRQEQIDTKVDYLANGGTDAKIRAGIADVVKPDLLRDDMGEQLEADRQHRDAGPQPL